MLHTVTDLSIDTNGVARVSGPLTLESVTAVYYKASAEATRGRHIEELDLADVPRVDSSGLALLLEWQSAITSEGRSLHIRNAPPGLLSLVRLCEANDLLQIEGRSPSGAPEKWPSGPARDQHS